MAQRKRRRWRRLWRRSWCQQHIMITVAYNQTVQKYGIMAPNIWFSCACVRARATILAHHPVTLTAAAGPFCRGCRCDMANTCDRNHLKRPLSKQKPASKYGETERRRDGREKRNKSKDEPTDSVGDKSDDKYNQIRMIQIRMAAVDRGANCWSTCSLRLGHIQSFDVIKTETKCSNYVARGECEEVAERKRRKRLDNSHRRKYHAFFAESITCLTFYFHLVVDAISHTIALTFIY